ncbi:methyltransferase [Streptomyces bungoensis]|uniref:Methyltransferase n=1 Tax=Streptomyces bungoensis TaxID=285568 RepID=A0A101SVV8_9ACTN|nr:O-methyltransferase [Streptomyces bungoensis]KUN81021.1 methyltransferase [Streptomyces bungoensis]
MEQERWNSVDAYFSSLLVKEDEALSKAARAHEDFDLPDLAVSAPQGKLLHLLARIGQARRILEIGTFGGYSSIWLARALPPDGRLVTIEWERSFADAAASRLAEAGVAHLVEQHVGRALDILPALDRPGTTPFDMVFVDANKPDIPEYFTWALKLSRPGAVVVVDNVVLGGAVTDPDHTDAGVQGVRRFHELLAGRTDVTATSIQTVGTKGYDGFTLALITG